MKRKTEREIDSRRSKGRRRREDFKCAWGGCEEGQEEGKENIRFYLTRVYTLLVLGFFNKRDGTPAVFSRAVIMKRAKRERPGIARKRRRKKRKGSDFGETWMHPSDLLKNSRPLVRGRR